VGDASKAVARILSEVQHTEDAIQMERPPQMQFLLVRETFFLPILPCFLCKCDSQDGSDTYSADGLPPSLS